MLSKTKITLFLVLLSVFLFIPCVYASSDDAVNVFEFPDRLATMLTIPLFAGQILASTIIVGLFVLPTAYTKNMIATFIMGILSLTLCIALTWLPYWLLIFVALIIGLMFSGSFRKLIGGGGD